MPPARVAEHARAEAMDDVRLAALDHFGRHRAGAKTEERIRRAPIDDRRASASGARERPVRNEPDRNARMDRIGRTVMCAAYA